MSRSSSRRLTATLVLVLSLLFHQLAQAAYVCPVEADAAALATMMSADMPCHDMDPQQPVLCHEHDKPAAQAPETLQPPAVVPAVAWVLTVLDLPDIRRPLSLLRNEAQAARPPPDPVFLSTRRLRV